MKHSRSSDRGLWSGDIARTTNAPTLSTCCVFYIATLAHGEERRAATTVDLPGAYSNACNPNYTRVRMQLNNFLTEVVVQLDLYHIQNTWVQTGNLLWNEAARQCTG